MRIFIFLISLAVLLGGLISPIPPPSLFSHSDKAMHATGFIVVALTARLAFIRTPAWLLWGVLLIFAPLSEWLQHTLQPTRSFSWTDIYANLIGVFLAAIIWKLLIFLHQRWQQRRTH